VTGPLHVSSNLPTENALKRFFPGDSEMALPMREFDWAPSRLGAAENWPQSLRTAQGICLTSRFPLHLYWGTELTLFYNDACIPFLGPAKHPALLGRSGRDAWAGGWDSIGPMIENIFSTGEAGCYEDIPGFFDRDLPREQVFVNFSFSPVIGSTGFFAPVQKPPVNRPAIGGSKRFVGRTRGLPSGTVLVWFAWRGVGRPPPDLENLPIMLSSARAGEGSRTEGLQAGRRRRPGQIVFGPGGYCTRRNLFKAFEAKKIA
jgi:hypothetical protein